MTDLRRPAGPLQSPEGLPTPVCWAALDSDHVASELEPLTRWVDWLVQHYRLDRRHVPECWAQHWELIEELSALHHSWKATYAYDTIENHGPLVWHERFATARDRLAEWTSRTGCRPGEHRLHSDDQRVG